MSILAVIFGNFITIALIGAILYYIYKKNNEKIDTVKEEIKDKIDEVESVMESINSIVDKINSILSNVSLSKE